MTPYPSLSIQARARRERLPPAHARQQPDSRPSERPQHETCGGERCAQTRCTSNERALVHSPPLIVLMRMLRTWHRMSSGVVLSHNSIGRQARQSAHLRILSTKRVAENASQKTFAYNQRSRAFSATHFADENSQLVGLTGMCWATTVRAR